MDLDFLDNLESLPVAGPDGRSMPMGMPMDFNDFLNWADTPATTQPVVEKDLNAATQPAVEKDLKNAATQPAVEKDLKAATQPVVEKDLNGCHPTSS
ncbi:hypothetical protein CEXT_149461 [Caerostris extrusa]|uniref:Uncharacterized protein n=1 Tax=Caerostris extrusa TaxID=172846 RepID=A0AAV4XQ94_CAEEX|nr:hypothetical protein CEXT_149461 [Caerostris extrusa]